MSKNYPQYYDHLCKLMKNTGNDIPETMKAFSALHEVNSKPGALSTKHKELIALGIAIAVHCDGCISFHVRDALRAGASRSEIAETIGVSILMGGGPSVIYGCEAMEAMEQFENEPA